MAGDTGEGEFSVEVALTAQVPATGKWQFGFYMPRPFCKIRRTNPRLSMEIRDGAGRSAALRYLVGGRVDLSAGYTTVLGPAGTFALVPGQRYTVRLQHSNQGTALNQSSAPQNFFFVDASGHVYPLSVSPGLLRLTDVKQTAGEIAQHVKKNWDDSATASTLLGIVPAPLSVRLHGGAFVLRDGLRVHDASGTAAHWLMEALAKDLKLRGVVVDKNVLASSGIIFKRVAGGDPEGYQIEIGPRAVLVQAATETGAFYAVQSLRQMFHRQARLTGATIIDAPRFKYRGLLVDVARHFRSVDDLELMLDLMAAHKLNTLHLHLADDEGFRLQMPFPTLSGVGGVRGYGRPITPMVMLDGQLDITNVTHAVYPTAATLYGGFYSRRDVARLVAYANRRHITIIPEIEMPGHARAMIRALPSAFVDPLDRSQYVSVQGYTDNVVPICTYGSPAGVGPSFTRTVDTMLEEIVAQFGRQTTPYHVAGEVSVAGDEVSADAWTQDASSVGPWASLSALGKAHLFFTLVSGRKPLVRLSGWQQLVQNDDGTLDMHRVAAPRTGHVWVWEPSVPGGVKAARALASGGYPTVLAFADETYLDLAYTPSVREPGFDWGTRYGDTCAALSSARSAGEVLEGLDASSRRNVLGIEGALWSEMIPTRAHFVYMALPKMAGLAEAGWSPASLTSGGGHLDWRDLSRRLGSGQGGFLGYLHDLYGVAYRGYPRGIHLEVPAAPAR